MLRNKFLVEKVRNREVMQEIYFKLTEKEKREFYDKHKEWFAVPGAVTLRQIYIANGKDPVQALARARDVVALARANGADFVVLVRRYSEDEGTKKDEGLLGKIEIPKLRDEVREAVAAAPVGTITDPIKVEVGYLIFRLEERKESVSRPFEDEQVMRAVSYKLTEERSEEKFEAYMQKLRTNAFIEIDPRYQPAVLKNKSAQIKRTPYSEEKKKKDKDSKEKKTDGKEDPKTTGKDKS
jgi:parvulin-like peptidyl-prolyl isomerase